MTTTLIGAPVILIITDQHGTRLESYPDKEKAERATLVLQEQGSRVYNFDSLILDHNLVLFLLKLLRDMGYR